MYYVNIRFIANVHLYPNTIVPICFLDTLQQQHLYFFFYKINTDTLALASPCEVLHMVLVHLASVVVKVLLKKPKKTRSLW